MRHVRDCGTRKTDRTGTGTLSVFGYTLAAVELGDPGSILGAEVALDTQCVPT